MHTTEERIPFWRLVCSGIGAAPLTPWKLDFWEMWGRYEFGEYWDRGEHGAAFNPLATTREALASEYAADDPYWNDNGGNPVKNYASMQIGARKTVETLTNGYYDNIVASVKAQSIEGRRTHIISELRNRWGTQNFATHIERGWSPTGATTGEVGEVPDYEQLVFSQLPVPGASISGRYLQSTGFWTPSNPHLGVDLAMGGSTMFGRLIYAPAPGVADVHPIDASGRPTDGWGNGSFGNCVVLDHLRTIWYSLYAHMNTILVADGQEVLRGQPIGTVGFSGYVDPPNVNGSHVHWQLSKHSGFPRDIAQGDDPLKYLNLDWVEPTPGPTPPTLEQRMAILEHRVLNLEGTDINVNQVLQLRWDLAQIPWYKNADLTRAMHRILKDAGYIDAE